MASEPGVDRIALSAPQRIDKPIDCAVSGATTIDLSGSL